MTPLTKIENGITTGNWALVCEGFNKLTGKKLLPPSPPKKEFDVNTASKRELYNFLKDKMPLDPIKSFTIDELKEIANVRLLEEGEEQKESETIEYENPYSAVHTPDKNGPIFMDGFRYTSGKKELLPMDKMKVVATLDPQLAAVKDPENEYMPRPAPQKINVKCLKCKKSFKQIAGFAVEVDGEKQSLCPICSESI